MKKLFVLILCVIFLVGCGGQTKPENQDAAPSTDSAETVDDAGSINYKEYTEYDEEDPRETDSAERKRKEKANILSTPLPDVNILNHNGRVISWNSTSYSDLAEAVSNPYFNSSNKDVPEELGEFFTHDLLADKKAKGTIIFSWNLYKKTSKEFSYKDVQKDAYNTAGLHFNSDGRVWIKMPENEIERNICISTYTEGNKEPVKGGYSVSYEINPRQKRTER